MDTVQKVKPSGPTIPGIFRAYGEHYIKRYRPERDHIKFIRAVRLCKSPALGGRVLECDKCKHLHYIYHSCGHSRCPCCQSIKREQWLDKMQRLLLPVPYVHLVTTMPHQFNRLSKQNPREMYNLLFRVTKILMWDIIGDDTYAGGTPGMVSVLHTFGSDMKYHVHVHSMITFGGLDEQGQWVYPKHKKRYCRNSKLRSDFKKIYLRELHKLKEQNKLQGTEKIGGLITELQDKSWTIFASHPSMTTQGITTYLSKYINRVAISEKRVKYIEKTRRVQISHKNYRNQKDDQAAPIAIKEMQPFTFIHQLLMHLPPPYFHRCRRYGLHANMKNTVAKKHVEQAAKQNNYTIRTVMQIIKDLMKLREFKCEKCQFTQFTTHELKPDKTFIFTYITLPKIRGPSHDTKQSRSISGT